MNPLETWAAVVALHADYAACLDEGRFNDWPNFFTEDARYRVIPRENYEAGHPLATIALDSRAMLKDRVYGATDTLFHAPYYQRHIISLPRILSIGEEAIEAEANYVILRTKRNEPAEVFNTGRYIDRIVQDGERLRFTQKLCVFDSELIANSIIYPI